MSSSNLKYANLQNIFARNLYMTLAENGDGNIFFSPFSIATVLAIAYMGSKKNTKKQIKEVLQFADKKSLKQVYSIYLKDLEEPCMEYELKTSNVAYLAKDYPILKDFKTSMLESFHTNLKTVDFSQSDAVTKEINELVEKETNSKIKNLIPNGTFNELTRMVLINAIYFKGLWDTPFKSKLTRDEYFWISATEFVKVPTMFMEYEVFATEALNDLDARMLTMSYKGNRISMHILLPNTRDGITAMEEKLKTANFSEILSFRNSELKIIEVYLPKFKLEESLDLTPTFEMMGLRDLFNIKDCNLSGITKENEVYISNVLHKACLEVNEEGTEAAAADGEGLIRGCTPITRGPPFVADHPFMFFIKDKISSLILFTGKVVKF